MVFFRFILVTLMFSNSLFSQEAEFIRGRLYGANTQEPIPFATIRIKNRAVGVISNQDGGFRIPKRLEKFGDSLLISCMGYETQEILLKGLSSDYINIIRLKPGVLELSEAILTAKRKRPLSARQIVRRAIKKIPLNYPLYSFSTVGYYRDYQFEDDQYINLNEAILQVYDKGFDSADQQTTKVRIYDYKQNSKFKRDTLPLQPYNYAGLGKVIDHAYLYNYGGNEFTILRVHDAIRNYRIDSYSFVHKLASDVLRIHHFAKAADTFLDDKVLYTIYFKKISNNYSAYGIFYIDKKSFAIYKMEYALYDKKKKLEQGKLNKRGTSDQLIFEILTEYNEHRDKLFLNYISFQNNFQVQEPPKFVIKEIIIDWSNQKFIVVFNNKPLENDVHIHENYQIRYKGKNLRIGEIRIRDNEVHISPVADPRVIAMFRDIEIKSRKEKMDLDLFDFDVKNIQDLAGNLLNESITRNFNQFREYFVQQVETAMLLPKDTLYMKKDRPIFIDQPIVKPVDFGDYWMNTPLQNIEK